PTEAPAKVKYEWQAPDFVQLLEPGNEQDIDQYFLLEQARIIEDTLSSFGAPGKVVEVNSGPVITQFGVEPDYIEKRGGRTRVKVSAIAGLDKDLALALAAKTIRIEAPVPGKGFVGIEVPNAESSQHSLVVRKSKLAIGLGQSVDGTPVSADLTTMPHLLIAGTTGSGKSVCVNAIITCLLLQNSPDELQFIMVDPKRVELTGYNGIPHLISNVVVDLERIIGVLKWVQREMDERYKKLNERTARNIEDYNRKLRDDETKMPYLVVVIDELADLMMLAPDETEKLIARLAQMARATGIHLIISTQRPSVDVVTGLIKANFPARIAFAVASGVDSRVILDGPGADRLLGRGDMLYQAPDASAPLRMQGVFVSDPEIERITRHWKEEAIVAKKGGSAPSPSALPKPHESAQPEATMPMARSERHDPERPRPAASSASQQSFWQEVDELAAQPSAEAGGDEDDDMYDEAVEVVRSLDKASISLLQRRLRIGYTRAARLIDLMEERGVIGPSESGSKPRRVLLSDD
ncbi:MAG: DNA translocase FtsK, partial [Anaerolineales bacterium]